MVFFLIIPLTIVAISGLIGYFLYRFVIHDYTANKAVNKKLKEYKIDKTQYQIIKEYLEIKGEPVTEKEISHLQKHYRQHEPEQFLAMYDYIRDKTGTGKNLK
ncbi:MAG: hypothetical protein ISR80_04770 [Nitrosopumilus sp.]|nr:hypothetical protein [Nitrosopumilus sp.]MDC4231736.1 hypothetical protein [Nitrosopumilus sp.]